MDENMFFRGVLSDYQDDYYDEPSYTAKASEAEFSTPDLPYPTGDGSGALREAVMPSAEAMPYDDGGDNIREEEITAAETTPYESTPMRKPKPLKPTPMQATSRSEFGHVNLKADEPEMMSREEVIGDVLGELKTHEGESGDTTGAAETLGQGLTVDTYNDMKKKYGKNITEAQARKFYMEDLYDAWEEKPGWDKASGKLKAGLLDSGYNLGTAPLKYKKLGKALSNLSEGGSEEDVMAELLDTATSSGKSMKGIAIRRASMYNKVAENPIAEVEQTDNGTVYYRDGKGKVVKRFRPKKGRHPDSRPEVVTL